MRTWLTHAVGVLAVSTLVALIGLHLLLIHDFQEAAKALAPAPCKQGCPCCPAKACDCNPCNCAEPCPCGRCKCKRCPGKPAPVIAYLCAAEDEGPGYWLPHLEDRERFCVTREYAVAAKELNRNLWAIVQSKRPREWGSDAWRTWQQTIDDLDQRYRVWDLIAVALGELPPGFGDGWYPSTEEDWALQALAELHDLIGEEAYAAGQLPCHVPEWLFSR